MKHKCHLQTPIGIVCIEEDNGSVTALFVDNEYEEGYYLCRSDEKMRFLDEPGTAVLKTAGTQLMEYFLCPFRLWGQSFRNGCGRHYSPFLTDRPEVTARSLRRLEIQRHAGQ